MAENSDLAKQLAALIAAQLMANKAKQVPPPTIQNSNHDQDIMECLFGTSDDIDLNTPPSNTCTTPPSTSTASSSNPSLSLSMPMLSLGDEFPPYVPSSLVSPDLDIKYEPTPLEKCASQSAPRPSTSSKGKDIIITPENESKYKEDLTKLSHYTDKKTESLKRSMKSIQSCETAFKNIQSIVSNHYDWLETTISSHRKSMDAQLAKLSSRIERLHEQLDCLDEGGDCNEICNVHCVERKLSKIKPPCGRKRPRGAKQE